MGQEDIELLCGGEVVVSAATGNSGGGVGGNCYREIFRKVWESIEGGVGVY